MIEVRRAIDRIYREEHGRILAPIARLLGIDRAEEVVQDAFEAAIAQWPREGVPEAPRAWLIRAARNKAIDRVRRGERWEHKRAALEDELRAELAHPIEEDDDAVRDDLLRLVFTCCHPSLAPEAQVALTLRTVSGLTTEEIARAFLTSREAMAQRLVRAKREIAERRIGYRIPEPRELPDRLEAVLKAIYLVFNEGYAASSGDVLIRRELCGEAIRLGELVCELLPDESEAKGLLALMLLHDSRRDARTDANGELVLLEEQDRARWDRAEIERGLALVDEALAKRPRAYAIQAAIAALHARAPRAEDTDWKQIAGLYHVLSRYLPTPIVELNHAVAVAMSGELVLGLRLLDSLDARGTLGGYHLLPAARADLLRRLGRADEARAAYARAIELVTNEVERRFLERRLAELGA